jgi:pimeloyl-[acyl-carrier protein] methyl ester esterase
VNINIVFEGQGNPLVLFHGWGFDSHIWYSLIPQLGQSHRLYLIDLPGFGSSSLMTWDRFKEELLKQLPDEFWLAGWSMGGLIATRLAIEAPHRVTHLVNIASSPYFIKDDTWPGINSDIFNTFYQNLTNNPAKTLNDFLNLQLQGQIVPLCSELPINQDGLQYGLDLLVHWDLRPQLNGLKMPVLYLFGRLDGIVPRKLMSIMQTRYPQFNYIMFSKAAHAPFLSHPNEFIAVLKDFLP